MPHAKLKDDAVGVDAESCNEALGIGCGRVGGTGLELRAEGLFVLRRLLLFGFFHGGHRV